ncbi:MAG: glycosyltransferase family 2 protein [Bacteroidetes bacterium]|nr:glycosyltransferase family 2 protein [Bacteroidota bacterium]
MIITSILHFFSLILYVYLAATTIYLLFVAIVGRLKKPFIYSSSPEKNKIAVLIPSYKEDNIIIDTASRALAHDYPSSHFDVYVIADKLKKETIDAMKALPVNVAEVKFDISTKSKSIHEALERIADRDYDFVMMLDADNVMEQGCLEKVNQAFNRGFKVVQCNRVAKNKNNEIAILDIISEEANNHYFRRGQRAIRSSASLAGSGMALEFGKIKEIFSLPEILENPGEDKEIDIQLMKAGIVTEFISNAHVYDEKVSSAAVFEKQRTRWLEAHLNALKRYFDKDVRAYANKRAYWHKLFQAILLPRSLYILLFAFIFIAFLIQHFIHYPLFYPAFIFWAILPVLYLIALALCIPSKLYNRDFLKAVIHFPVLMISMIKALTKIKPGRKEFLHTPKTHTGDSK